MGEQIPPFSIPQMRSWFPEKLRPWFFIPLVIIYQLSGGIYLAAMAEVVGSLQLRQEDVMYAGYAGLAGMCVVFGIMFRLKFRFAPRFTHLVCCCGIIICNLITMYVTSVPLLIVTCWVCGIFRMWGTFECNSTIQLWLTPVRFLPVFFCWVEALVQCNLCMNGIFSSLVVSFAKWEYLHLGMIFLLLMVMLLVLIFMNDGKYTPFMKLYGIDWIGAFTWSVTLMALTFVFVYGEHYDWLHSWQIRIASLVAILLIVSNVYRAKVMRHPWYPNRIFFHRSVWAACLSCVWVNILVSPEHVLEHLLYDHILGYDEIHATSLNWAVVAGIVTASFFTLFTFARRMWSYRVMGTIALLAITMYLLLMSVSVDYGIPKETMYLPLFCRGFGHTMFGILLLSSLTRVEFPMFFQSLSVQNSFSAVLGGAIGSAVMARLLKIKMLANAALLEINLDNVNVQAVAKDSVTLYGMVSRLVMLVSIKEIYGMLTIASLFTLVLIMVYCSDFSLSNIKSFFLCNIYRKNDCGLNNNV